jgi:hypothetical protein
VVFHKRCHFSFLPIFGVYVVGKDWYFVVLNDNNYCVSRPYQANEAQDFLIIVKALKTLKVFLKNSDTW